MVTPDNVRGGRVAVQDCRHYESALLRLIFLLTRLRLSCGSQLANIYVTVASGSITYALSAILENPTAVSLSATALPGNLRKVLHRMRN